MLCHLQFRLLFDLEKARAPVNSFVWTLAWIGTFMRIRSREQRQFLPTPRLVGMESKTMYWDLPHLHRWANKNPSLLSQIWWSTFHTCNNELKKKDPHCYLEVPHCYLEVDNRPATSATMSSKQKQNETSIVVSKPMINLPHRWAQNKNKKNIHRCLKANDRPPTLAPTS